MTIKTECVVKYLKHDYKEIGIIVGGIAVAIGVVALTLLGMPYITSALGSVIIPVWSGYNVLNTFAALTVLTFTVGIVVFWDKKTFALKEFDGYGNPTGVVGNFGIKTPLLLAGVVGLVIYGTYALARTSMPYWESPVLSLVVFTILLLVGVPIGCAIARCKE